MHEIGDRLAELDPTQETIVICEHGVRSMAVARYLTYEAGFTKVYNMIGGMAAWTGPVQAAGSLPPF